jgi:Xaa-Pro aminopeptidase
MNPLFDSKVYQNRRAKLTQLMKEGIALFLGNEESPMNYPSNQYKQRQDSNFLYFFGLSLSNFAAVIDFDNEQTILFGTDFEIDDIIWMGDQPKVQDLAARVGITETRPMAELAGYIAAQKGRKIHFTPPYRAENKIALSKLTSIAIDDLKASASVALIKSIVSLREIKDEFEIQEIEKACVIGHKMHTEVMKNCRVGKTEQELFGIAEGITLSYGNGVSFPIILSQHGETLHNHNHNQVLEDGKLLLMDAGAENLMNYSSDNTRTFPVNGKFTPKQKAIYEIVLKANVEGINACKPGIRYREIHKLAMTIITDGLKALGLMKGDTEAAVEAGATALFMPHGLGHQMGLDVHDMEDLGENYVGYDDTIQRSKIFGWGSLRMAKELRPGHVLTVEPGIYFVPHLIDIWKNEKKFEEYINYDKVEEYRDFGGIRIEDDVLITETGHRILGPAIPKTVEELENFIGRE